MAKPEVTVIVPVWNRRDLLRLVMDKLRAQTYPVAEVLVIDNGSEDGSAELGESLGARVVRMGYNAGFSRAVNRGIEQCHTEWLAIVNNDVEPSAEWLQRLMAAAQQPRIWFATGKILNAIERDRIDGTFDALCRGGCPWRVGHARKDGPEFSRACQTWFAPATAALYRSELFRKIGLLDETFESYLEDVEFGLRCACRGYAGMYVPEAVAFHVGSATLGRWHPETVRRTARNQVLLIAKYYPARLLIRYAWPILVAQGLWGLLALRHGAGLAFFHGKMSGLKLFAKARRQGDQTCTGLKKTLLESERQIRETQRRTGFDLYWRLYFFLIGGGAN